MSKYTRQERQYCQHINLLLESIGSQEGGDYYMIILVYNFKYEPYAELYRVEFDLTQPSTKPVYLPISSRSGKCVHQKVFAAGVWYFDELFDV